MADLLRLSEATALALHTMVMIGGNQGPVSAAPMAKGLGASEAHLFKVLQQLVRAGLLRSKRGPNGGYELARPGSEITLMEVYEVFEGSMRRDGCLFDRPQCERLTCILSTLVQDVRDQVVRHFETTSVEDAATR